MRAEIGFGIGQTKDGHAIPNLVDSLHLIVQKASEWFGGCNLTFGIGGWKPNGLPVVKEASAVLTLHSAFRAETEEGRRWIATAKFMAESIRDRLDQEAVFFAVLEATPELI